VTLLLRGLSKWVCHFDSASAQSSWLVRSPKRFL